MPRAGGGLLRLPEHGLLERLGDREPHLLPGRNLDGLAGLRVAAHAGLHLAEPEDAQPRDLDGLALLDALHDRLGQEVEHLIGLLTVHATRFRKLRPQLRLRHRRNPWGVTGLPLCRRWNARLRQANGECKETPRQSRAGELPGAVASGAAQPADRAGEPLSGRGGGPPPAPPVTLQAERAGTTA